MSDAKVVPDEESALALGLGSVSEKPTAVVASALAGKSGGLYTLWILIPLVLLIEVGVTLPLNVVHPDHELHINTICSGCNIDSQTLWSALNVDDVTCISDTILMEIGESFQGFVQNYLATMLGHVLTVYALINAQDGDVHHKIGAKEKMHMLAYGILIIDMIVEIFLLQLIKNTDPNSLKLDEYTSCNSKTVEEIEVHKKDLIGFAKIVLWLRLAVAFVVTFIYVVKSNPSSDAGEEEDAKDKDKEGKYK